MNGQKNHFKILAAVCLHFTTVSGIVLGRTYIDLLFLSHYPASWLPYFFIGTTITVLAASFIITPLVSRGSNIINFSVLVLMASTVVLSKMILKIDLPGGPFGISLWLTAVTVMAGVISWNTVGDAFDVRRFKSVSRWCNSAGCVGGLAIGILIPVIISFHSSDILLYLLSILLILASLCLLKLKPIPSIHKKADERVSLFKFPLFRFLFFSSLILMFVDTLADYALKSQVSMVFSKDEIGKFMGPFYGLASILSLVVQLGGTNLILKNLGVAFLLLVLPAFAVLSSLGIIVYPGLWMASVLKMGENVFRYSLDNIGCAIAANPLPGKIRRKGKLVLKGVATPLGTCIGAIILWLIGERYGLRGVALLVMMASVIWFLIIRKISTAYQSTLKEAIKLKHFSLNANEISETTLIAAEDFALSALKGPHPDTIKFGLRTLESISVTKLPENALVLINSESKEIRAAVAKTAGRLKDKNAALPLTDRLKLETDSNVVWRILEALSVIEPALALDKASELLRDDTPCIRAGAVLVLFSAGDLDAVIEAGIVLKEMIYNTDPAMREGAAIAIGSFKAGKLEKELRALLNDLDENVVVAAIQSIRFRKTLSLTHDLVLKLGTGRVSRYAGRALTVFGPPAVQCLKEAILGKHLSRPRAAIRTLALTMAPETEDTLIAVFSAGDLSVKTILAKESALRARRHKVTKSFKLNARKLICEAYDNIKLFHSAKQNAGLSDFAKTEIHARQKIHETIFLYWFAVFTQPSEVIDMVKILLSDNLSQFELLRRATALELLETLAPDRDLKAMITVFESDHGISDNKSIEDLAEMNDPWINQVIGARYVNYHGGEMDNIQKVMILRKTNLFKNLTSELLLIIAEESAVREMVKDEKIFSQGDAPDGLYIIVSGKVIIKKTGVIISKLNKGDFFGEIGLLDNTPRMADAMAETEGTLLVIENETFNSMTDDLPEILREVTRTVIGYLKRQRSYFRVSPSANEPIRLLVEKSDYQLKNICIGGFCIKFDNEIQNLKIGNEYPCTISLPFTDNIISAASRIVNITEESYHCEMINLKEADRDQINLYVLERQRENLLAKQKNNGAPDLTPPGRH